MDQDELIELYFTDILSAKQKREFDTLLTNENFKKKVYEEYVLRKSIGGLEAKNHKTEINYSIWSIEEETNNKAKNIQKTKKNIKPPVSKINYTNIIIISITTMLCIITAYILISHHNNIF